MAWTSMHFAVGMAGAGALALAVCAVRRRGWRWAPLAMTIGGVWGIAPDLPRLFRDDFPSLPGANVLGAAGFEKWLHSWGNLFFGHRLLDQHRHEYALHGLILMILLYNLGLGLLLWLEHRQRNSIGNRAWAARAPFGTKPAGKIREAAPALRLAAEDGEPVLPQRAHASHYSRVS